MEAAGVLTADVMPAVSASKYLVQATWDDSSPHLDDKMKAEILASTPEYLRDARSKGEPHLGAGAIYPVPLSDVLVDPIKLPAYWPRAYALDVGWNKTCAIWGALDREMDIWYLYTEHYRGKAEPSIHATAIKARGDWIPGVIDPAAAGSNQEDGTRLIDIYRGLGLNLVPCKNAVEAGLYACWERLSTGRLKVFRTLQNWQSEYRIYRRDEDGKVIKKHDHAMDAMRYLIMSGKECAIPVPIDRGKMIGAIGGDDYIGW